MIYGDAKGGIRLTVNLDPGLQARAERWAGGENLNTGAGILEAIQNIPQDVWNAYKYTPNGLIIQGLQNLNSPSQVETYLNNNPEVKSKIKSALTDLWKGIVNPLKSTSLLITALPYLAIGSLIVLAVFAFKNPGSVSLPKKLSLT